MSYIVAIYLIKRRRKYLSSFFLLFIRNDLLQTAVRGWGIDTALDIYLVLKTLWKRTKHFAGTNSHVLFVARTCFTPFVEDIVNSSKNLPNEISIFFKKLWWNTKSTWGLINNQKIWYRNNVAMNSYKLNVLKLLEIIHLDERICWLSSRVVW